MVQLIRLLGAICVALCLAVATLAACIWWAQVAAVFLGRRSLGLDAVDFTTLYAAGRLVVTGHAHGLFDPDALLAIRRADTPQGETVHLAYLNPPFFAALIAPIALMPFARAYQVWTGVNIALLCAACWMVWLATPALPRWQRALLIVAFITSYPVTLVLRLGQFSMILLVSWTAAYILLRAGRDRAAGVALALLLIKPELLIPVSLILVWKRRFEVFTTLAPLAIVAVAASFAVVGPAQALHYPGFILHNAGDASNGTRPNFMFGWNGLLGAFLGAGHPLVTTLLSMPLALLTLAAAARIWRGELESHAPKFAYQWLILTLATVLADPNFFLQDIVIVVPAVCVVFGQTRGSARPAMALVVIVGWVLLGLGVDPGVRWHVNLVSISMVAGVVALALRETDLPARLTSRFSTTFSRARHAPALPSAADAWPPSEHESSTGEQAA